MEIFKSVKTEAAKEFEKLLDSQFTKTQNLVEGKIIEGVVTKITEKGEFAGGQLSSGFSLQLSAMANRALKLEFPIDKKIPKEIFSS